MKLVTDWRSCSLLRSSSRFASIIRDTRLGSGPDPRRSASKSSVRDQRIELRTARSRIPSYIHEIRYRLREDRRLARREWINEKAGRRNRSLSLRTAAAALVDPVRFRIRGEGTGARLTTFVFLSSTASDPVTIFLLFDLLLLNASRSILPEFLSCFMMQKENAGLYKKKASACYRICLRLTVFKVIYLCFSFKFNNISIYDNDKVSEEDILAINLIILIKNLYQRNYFNFLRAK